MLRFYHNLLKCLNHQKHVSLFIFIINSSTYFSSSTTTVSSKSMASDPEQPTFAKVFSLSPFRFSSFSSSLGNSLSTMNLNYVHI